MRRIWPILFSAMVAFQMCHSSFAKPLAGDSTIEPSVDVKEEVIPSPTETGSFPAQKEKLEEEIVIKSPGQTKSYDIALQPLVTKAVDDLSNRLNVDIDQIRVIEAEMVVWPDASMGCPQPDMVYKQVPVDGLLIRLGVADKVYEYHGGGWRDPFLCEQVIKVKPGSPKIDLLKRTEPHRNTRDRQPPRSVDNK